MELPAEVLGLQVLAPSEAEMRLVAGYVDSRGMQFSDGIPVSAFGHLLELAVLALEKDKD